MEDEDRTTVIDPIRLLIHDLQPMKGWAHSEGGRIRSVLLALASLLGSMGIGIAEGPQVMAGPQIKRQGAADGNSWFGTLQAGYIHQFESSLDEGGSLQVDRFAVVGGAGYRPGFSRSLALNVGFDLDDYSFASVPGGSLWSTIHTLKLGAPVRWGIDEHWTLFVIPTVRWTAEDGADWGQSFGGGGFAGVSYRFGERLTIGPGFGALTQLEASPGYFPVLIIAWKITDRLRLETGRGLGASQGPGLVLTYAPTPEWQLSLGGRYERSRFRLTEGGPTRGGVGEDRGFPLYVGATWRWTEDASISLLGGVRLGGRLKLDDANGDEILESDYEAGPFVGFAFDWRI